MEWLCEEEIRGRMGQFKQTIVGTEFSIEENLFKDYMAKYGVHREAEYKGLLVVYYSPNKRRFTLKGEKLEEDTLLQLKSLFENPAPQKKTFVTEESDGHRELKALYEILRKYRDKNFDFGCFREMLAAEYSDEKTKNEIAASSFDFDMLEEYYFKLINKR